MLSSLIAYDDEYNVIATLDYRVLYDDNGAPLGLVDFAAHEAAGGELTDVWHFRYGNVGEPETPARGSKVWPEWLGIVAHNFRVELAGPPGRKHIAALVHKTSGHRRERAPLEAAIAGRIEAAKGKPADIRDLVGGPDRPLNLDAEGRTARRAPVSRPDLPLVAARLPSVNRR
jgi:hypothetical protein